MGNELQLNENEKNIVYVICNGRRLGEAVYPVCFGERTNIPAENRFYTNFAPCLCSS